MTTRNDIIREIELRLGGGMVDVELDRDHYDIAINRAISKYRQRSSNSVEEGYLVLDLQPQQDTYILPQEVIQVRYLFRSGAGGVSSGVSFEPFGAAYINAYLLQSTGSGSLVNYEIYSQYRELLGRMFGQEIIFDWVEQTKTLRLHRNIKSQNDSIIVQAYMFRPDVSLFNDVYAGSWIKDYSTAHAKMMLGEARSKFAQIAGPQGGSSLNGENLKVEAQAEIEKLDLSIGLYEEGGKPLGIVIG